MHVKIDFKYEFKDSYIYGDRNVRGVCNLASTGRLLEGND